MPVQEQTQESARLQVEARESRAGWGAAGWALLATAGLVLTLEAQAMGESSHCCMDRTASVIVLSGARAGRVMARASGGRRALTASVRTTAEVAAPVVHFDLPTKLLVVVPPRTGEIMADRKKHCQ